MSKRNQNTDSVRGRCASIRPGGGPRSLCPRCPGGTSRPAPRAGHPTTLHSTQAQQVGLQEAVPLGNGQFGKRLGDVWQQYTCTAITVPVREADHCLSAIPVTHPSWGFLSFRTRVLQATASAEPCLEHFPVRVHTTTGWICLLPAITAEPAPRPAQQAAHILHHHADRPTGLYRDMNCRSGSTSNPSPPFDVP